MSFFGDHWAKKQTELSESKARGEVRMWVVGRRLHVSAPYTDEFKAAALELAGTWRPKTGVWTFNNRTSRIIVNLCTRIYGAGSIVIVDAGISGRN